MTGPRAVSLLTDSLTKWRLREKDLGGRPSTNPQELGHLLSLLARCISRPQLELSGARRTLWQSLTQ